MEVPVTLTLNATIDVPVGNMAYIKLDETSPFVDISGGGVITIGDFQSAFGQVITRNQVSANVSVKSGGEWKDLGIVPPRISYNGTDDLLQTAVWTLNEENGSIQKIKITLF